MENTNVTLREVAQRVAVFPWCERLSRAFGKEGVSGDAQRILETAEEMGYTANLAASALKKETGDGRHHSAGGAERRRTISITCEGLPRIYSGKFDLSDQLSEFPYALSRSTSEERSRCSPNWTRFTRNTAKRAGRIDYRSATNSPCLTGKPETIRRPRIRGC